MGGPVPEEARGTVRPVEAPADDLVELGQRVFDAWRELRRGAGVSSLREHLYGSGEDALDPGQLDALELVLQRGAWRMSELATALYVDASTATRTIDRLVDSGLVVRRPATEDGRGIVVSATAKGRKQCARIQRGRTELMLTFLDDFEPDEAQSLATLMERLVASVNRVANRRA
jgi:DNA-binding MarR family transcriptional regulator